ncbi:hypothetical protein [Alicyclobacillus mengziensis]|uniref:Lipoprotein n=1 Tax=Alicyclobacillus mengziensis TaxID=2931921 RepID=A0A9X7VWD4_9BACL|nr:hypothetical protein [Alicyclobacillus mengziensis]QSO45854.1 hypothetical protein JZ786_15050 [Alicyclobacillus mengziensis]
MKRHKQWLTAGLALSIVGVLAGCATTGNTQVNKSGTTNTSQSQSNSTNDTSGQPSNVTNKTSTVENQASGQQSGTKSATAGYYKGLKTVTYASAETQKIKQISQQQGITAYVPGKMGGPSGYYVPGNAAKGSSHSITISFEDMSFYEAPSWQDIKQALSPKNGSIDVLAGGSYMLSGNKQGQWYTLKYSDGARSDIYAFQEGNTWVGIVPNPAKSTIPSLVQAVAQTLRPIS